MDNGTKIGSRVDVFSVQKSSDCKHYDDGEPIQEKYRIEGRRIEIVPKDVTYETLLCPECGTELWYDEMRDAVCPDCGIVNPSYSERAKLDFNPSSMGHHESREDQEA